MARAPSDRITIQRRQVVGNDAMGNEIEQWSDLATIWADAKQTDGREVVHASGIYSDVSTVFKLRSNPLGITVLDRLVYLGTTHTIHEVRPLGRLKGVELHTKARS